VLLGLGWGELSQILALPQPLQLALDKLVEAVSWFVISGSLEVGWMSQGLW